MICDSVLIPRFIFVYWQFLDFHDVNKVTQWFERNKMSINLGKYFSRIFYQAVAAIIIDLQYKQPINDRIRSL